MKLTAIACILTIASVTGENVCPPGEEYTLELEDSYGDGWDSGGLELKATFTNGTSSNFALPYSSSRKSKYGDVNLCQVVALEVSRGPGQYDDSESSYSLIRGNETITWGGPHTIGTVWANCPDGKGWTGTACDSCADHQIITDDICTDCPAGEEAEGNECVCNGDVYTLVMEDKYGDGWYRLMLSAHIGDTVVDYKLEGSEQNVTLCNAETVFVKQGTLSSFSDPIQSSFTLFRGDTVILKKEGSYENPLLLSANDVLWADCSDGQGWNGAACGSCAADQIITNGVCTGCPVGEEISNGVCKECNGDKYTLKMFSLWGTGWSSLQLSSTSETSSGTSTETHTLIGGGTDTHTICNLQKLEISVASGGNDAFDASFTLSKGDNVIVQKSGSLSTGIAWEKCDSNSWTGTECGVCGSDQFTVEGTCMDCPLGEEKIGDKCICNDPYTLQIKSSRSLYGWDYLRLIVDVNGVKGGPYALAKASEQSEKNISLCSIHALEFSERGLSSTDQKTASFTLFHGDTVVLNVGGTDDNLVYLNGSPLWTNCPVGQEWTGTECGCPLGMVNDNDVCKCSGDTHTLQMKDSDKNGWWSLKLRAKSGSAERDYKLTYILPGVGQTGIQQIEQNVTLCNINALQVVKGTSSSDSIRASFTLFHDGSIVEKWEGSATNNLVLDVNDLLWANCPDGQGWNGTACASCADNQITTNNVCTDCPTGLEAEGNVCKCPTDGAVLENDECKCPTGSLVLNGACVSREYFICSEDVAIDCEGVCGGSLCSNVLDNQIDFSGDTLGSLTGGNNKIKLAVSSDGKNLYAVGDVSKAIVYWDLGPSGALSNRKEFSFDHKGSDVEVSPDGKSVFVASKLHDKVFYWDRDLSTGELSNMQTLNDMVSPTDVRVSPNNARVYIIASTKFYIMSRNNETGSLSNLNFINVVVRHVSESPDGKNVYAAATPSDSIMYWNIDSSGDLVAHSLTWYLIDNINLDLVEDVVVSPDGKNVYAVASGSDSIVQWDRNPESGALSNQVNLIDETNLRMVSEVVVSSDGKFVYALASWKFVQWDRDPTTGLLINQHTTDYQYLDHIALTNNGVYAGAALSFFDVYQISHWDRSKTDVCGVLGGSGIPEGKCDCAGNGIPEGKCDCGGSTACLSTEGGTLIAPDHALELTKAYKKIACDNSAGSDVTR